MRKLHIRKLQVLLGLVAILVMVTSLLGRLGVVYASPALLSDPPANQVAVKLKSWASISTILSRYNATQVDVITESNVYMLQLPSGQTADQMLPMLNADNDLHYAEPNYYAENAPDGTKVTITGTKVTITGTGAITPMPGGGADQWAWQKINRTDAQQISQGKGVIVAVLDTGMAANTLINSNIYRGYDFVKVTESFLDTGNGLDDNEDGLVDEFVGHGTHVAGIIVSTTTPTGVTDPMNVRIMPIRVLNSDGMGTYTDLAKGIRYAVDNGADVINMSLTAPRLVPVLSDALAYAAARGVLVVTAAGNNDPGPNYPAHYSDPLAVITVGATDRNDAIASFSGGLAGDIDVFAPGVDIYSSYPHNGFALGTGTSMAAPIVAGEAAMLISKHPDWSMTEIAQRIISKGATVSGSSAKRVDLVAALNTGIEVNHFPYDPYESTVDGTIITRLRLMNNTPLAIPLSELKLRYWYTMDSVASQIFQADYCSLFTCPDPAKVTGTFTTLASDSPNKTSLSDMYYETGFTANAGTLPAGGEFGTYLRASKANPNTYTKTNDYSFDASRPDRARWERITVYRNGTLVWGVEPTSGTILTRTPTRTPTLHVPTATHTKTATSSAPTATYTKTQSPSATKTPTLAANTATKTNTPLSSTATKTNTPAGSTATKTYTPAASTATKTSTSAASTATKTSTSVASTATRTSTPIPPTATSSSGGVKVQMQKDPTSNDTTSSVAYYVLVVNNGTTAVSNISTRVYFTIDGSYTAYQYILEKYYGPSECTVQSPTLASGSTYYFTVNCGGASLAAGASWQLNFGYHLADWTANLNSTNDWWHTTGALPTSFTDWTYIPAYINGSRVWGVEAP